MNNQIIPVSFHGDTLALVDHEGEPFVAMKPIVENMGLAWQAQHIKLSEKFGSTITIIVTVGEDGRQREMVCLPLRKFPAWVYSVSPNKVRPELREKISRYQEECDDVLWKYWTEGHVERAGVKRATISQQLSAHNVLMRLPDKLEVERHPLKRELLKGQIDHACRILGIAVPDLDAIGFAEAAPTVPPLVETFWDAVERIGLDALNHSRDPRLIAINLVHFAERTEAVRLRLPDVHEFRRVLRLSKSPRFVDVKTVNSRLADGSVKCWVFEVPPDSLI